MQPIYFIYIVNPASFISRFTHYALTLTLSPKRGDFCSLAPWGEGWGEGGREAVNIEKSVNYFLMLDERCRQYIQIDIFCFILVTLT